MKKTIIVSLVGLLIACLLIPCYAYPLVDGYETVLTFDLLYEHSNAYFTAGETELERHALEGIDKVYIGSLSLYDWGDMLQDTVTQQEITLEELAFSGSLPSNIPDDAAEVVVYVQGYNSGSTVWEDVGSYSFDFYVPINPDIWRTAGYENYSVRIWVQSIELTSSLVVPGLVEYEPNTFFYAIKEWVTDVLIDDFLGFGDLLPSDQTAVSIVSLLLCLVVFAVPIILVILVIKFFVR